MKIITNTAALFRPEEGKRLGITVVPAGVSVGDRALRDYIDIGADEYTELLKIRESAFSSQPSVGDVMEALADPDEEAIVLTVGDGLSGEYMTALGVREGLPNRDRIHVIDSGSLGGPLRYLALRAAALRDEGRPAKEIAAKIREDVRSSVSFVIPSDFGFLRKSGRVSGVTSKIGGALKLLPVLTQTEDRRRIALLTVKRTWKAAQGAVLNRLAEIGIDDNYFVTVSFADRKDIAESVLARIRERFPRTESEVLQLSPSLITHGGPGCIVVQAIRKIRGADGIEAEEGGAEK